MELAIRYHSSSGFEAERLAFLAMRWKKGTAFKPQYGESWMVGATGSKQLTLLYGGQGWLTGCWYSEEGTVYVSDTRGQVVVFRDVPSWKKSNGQRYDVRAPLMGIWGLSESFVIAWADKDREHGAMFRWNGRKWTEMESPGPGVIAAHGIAPDLICAVGEKGLIARWDGRKWLKARPPTRTALSSVYVCSPDEMYACGISGRLLEGSVRGWSEVLTAKGALFGVAKWKDELWVAGGAQGLLKRDRNQLTVVKNNIKAEGIDSRGQLLLCEPGEIDHTADGKKFFGIGHGFIDKMLAGKAPDWLSQ